MNRKAERKRQERWDKLSAERAERRERGKLWAVAQGDTIAQRRVEWYWQAAYRIGASVGLDPTSYAVYSFAQEILTAALDYFEGRADMNLVRISAELRRQHDDELTNESLGGKRSIRLT